MLDRKVLKYRCCQNYVMALVYKYLQLYTINLIP
jgi:hypothetical protein